MADATALTSARSDAVALPFTKSMLAHESAPPAQPRRRFAQTGGGGFPAKASVGDRDAGALLAPGDQAFAAPVGA